MLFPSDSRISFLQTLITSQIPNSRIKHQKSSKTIRKVMNTWRRLWISNKPTTNTTSHAFQFRNTNNKSESIQARPKQRWTGIQNIKCVIRELCKYLNNENMHRHNHTLYFFIALCHYRNRGEKWISDKLGLKTWHIIYLKIEQLVILGFEFFLSFYSFCYALRLVFFYR